MVRLARVEYLNTAPLVEGLDGIPGISLVRGVPADLAGMLLDDEAEVALASVIDAARHPLVLLPAGMIGCDGPTLTVRLFSRVPFGRVRELHADVESHTSVALARVILDRMYGVRPEIVELDTTMPPGGGTPGCGAGEVDGPETLLLIGDKVVTRAPSPERYPHQLDLGAAWKDRTGLPFVYAAWAVRADRAGDPRFALVRDLLDRQRRRNAMRLGWIAARRAPEHGWPVGLAHRYLAGLLRYAVADRERTAVARFIAECASLGLCPSVSPAWLAA